MGIVTDADLYSPMKKMTHFYLSIDGECHRQVVVVVFPVICLYRQQKPWLVSIHMTSLADIWKYVLCIDSVTFCSPLESAPHYICL